MTQHKHIEFLLLPSFPFTLPETRFSSVLNFHVFYALCLSFVSFHILLQHGRPANEASAKLRRTSSKNNAGMSVEEVFTVAMMLVTCCKRWASSRYTSLCRKAPNCCREVRFSVQNTMSVREYFLLVPYGNGAHRTEPRA